MIHFINSSNVESINAHQSLEEWRESGQPELIVQSL